LSKEIYNDYLQREADYQDQKIVNNPRQYIRKLYHDTASQYRYNCRNKLVGEISGKKVLDLGCGNGFASIEALRSGAYVTAIDISSKSIQYLLEAAKAENLDDRLEALVMDAHELSFDGNTFDVVFGNGILHHLSDLDIALGEIKRVLKKDGYAVFMEPLGMNLFLNLFRRVTPNLRTADEQPFRTQEFNLIKRHFPNVHFVFFDFATLLSKVPLLLGWNKIAQCFQKILIPIDDLLLRKNTSSKITVLQKMAWMVVMKLQKE